MARIRTLKPEFWQDEKLVTLPDVTRLIFLGLVSLADDAGRLLDKPVKIEADLFDGMHDRSRDVRESLANLSRIGVIRRGLTASGQRVIEIVNWKKHQRVDHPNLKAAFPQIVTVLEDTEIREAFANDSRGIREAFAHHTNDLHTNDQRPTTKSAARKRTAPGEAKAWPHFTQDDRARVLAAFRKVGEFSAGRVINAVGACYRPATDPEHIPHGYVSLGVEDYCGLISKGRSAPFASPEDCGKKLIALARNCQQHEERFDPVGRLDSNLIAIHGAVPRVAA
jgi:hypothetical protein